MSHSGESPDPLVVEARKALLDALEALDTHREALVVIGAQAVYFHTGALIDVALAEMTTDGDIAVDPNRLDSDPLVEIAMKSAGFVAGEESSPGSWISKTGVPVDLMVPELLAGKGRRSANIPPHDRKSMRKTPGIEATILDNSVGVISSFQEHDPRSFDVKIAGPASLIIAKLFKIADRNNDQKRLQDKDAHDIYRLLRAVATEELSSKFLWLGNEEISAGVTDRSLELLSEYFAGGPGAIGSQMAGRAEELVGNPEEVSLAVSLLSADLLASIQKNGELS